MSLLRLPFSADGDIDLGIEWDDRRMRWEQIDESAFPTDPQELSKDNWFRFITRYQLFHPNPTAEFAIQAPSNGHVRLIKRDDQYLIIFKPLNPIDFRFQAGGWEAPHFDALVFHVEFLSEENNRRKILRQWLSVSEVFNRRHLLLSETVAGSRINDMYENPGLLNSYAAAYVSPNIISGANTNLGSLERIGYTHNIFVAKGDPISKVNSGVAGIGCALTTQADDFGETLANSWYWLDAHEVLTRLMIENRIPLYSRPFGFEERRNALSVWYERTTLNTNRISQIFSGDVDMVLYNPPPSTIPIPKEILFQREINSADNPNPFLKLYSASATLPNWSTEWLETSGSPLTIVDPDPPLTINADHSCESRFHWPSTNPDLSRSEILVRINSQIGMENSISFFASRDQLELAFRTAKEVIGHFATQLSWLSSTTLPSYLNPELIPDEDFRDKHDPISNRDLALLASKQQSVIEQLRRLVTGPFDRYEAYADGLTAALRETDGEYTTDRRRHFLDTFGSIAANFKTSLQLLKSQIKPELYDSVMNSSSSSAIEKLDTINDALGKSLEGRMFLYSKMYGFFDTEPIVIGGEPPRPVFNAASYKALWARLRGARGTLGKILLDYAQADIVARSTHLDLNTLEVINPPEYLERAMLSRRRKFIGEFGNLDGITINVRNIDNINSEITVSLDPGPGRIPRQSIHGIYAALNLFAWIYDASALYHDPTYRNITIFLTGTSELLSNSMEICMYVQARRSNTNLSISRLQRWRDFSNPLKVAGLVNSAAYLPAIGSDILDAYSSREDYRLVGHTASLGVAYADIGIGIYGVLSARAIATGAVTATSTAWTGPISIVLMIAGIAATVLPILLEPSEMEKVFSYSIFGDDYTDLLPGEPPNNFPLYRTDITSNYADWWNSIGATIAHTNNIIMPLNATFSKEIVIAGGVPELVIKAKPTKIAWGSKIWIQFWTDGDSISERQTRTFSFTVHDTRNYPVTVPRDFDAGEVAYVKTEELPTNEIEFSIKCNARNTADRVAIAVSHSPLEYERGWNVQYLHDDLIAHPFSMAFIELNDLT